MIIIPDIHGRTFWKSAVEGREADEILFLGDYVDPYSFFEDVESKDGMIALLEIIDFKKMHMENVTLLLGNHDLSYIDNLMPKCRYDYENEITIREAFLDNIHLFSIASEKRLANRLYLFSHAGILPDWLHNNKACLDGVKLENAAATINEKFHNGSLYTALSDVSLYRGGSSSCGSCVWADVHEHYDYFQNPDTTIPSVIYQVFGHTQLLSRLPLITEHFACLDCRKAFLLDDIGRFTEL